LALLDFCAAAPVILRLFLFNKWEAFHKEVTSDIPGNPHAFSAAVISLFRTLPEPSNLNLIFSGLPLGEALVISGQLPEARYSSLSVYGAGTADPPSSVELQCDGSRTFQVTISSLEEDGPSDGPHQAWVRINPWKRGFISMRNYLVPPGTLVTTPLIQRLRDGKVIRPQQQIVAGPCATATALRGLEGRVALVLAVAAHLLVLAGRSAAEQSLAECALLLCCGAVGGAALHQLCFLLGARRLEQLTRGICAENNRLYFASLEEGSKASQPSKLHRYWVMRLDLQGRELRVSVRIRSSAQKYWSLVVYDKYGLPLPQYVFDGNYTASCHEKHGNTDEYDVDIRLRAGRSPTPAGAVVVDVSAAAGGYVLFRINHPASDDPADLPIPLAHLS